MLIRKQLQPIKSKIKKDDKSNIDKQIVKMSLPAFTNDWIDK